MTLTSRAIPTSAPFAWAALRLPAPPHGHWTVDAFETKKRLSAVSVVPAVLLTQGGLLKLCWDESKRWTRPVSWPTLHGIR